MMAKLTLGSRYPRFYTEAVSGRVDTATSRAVGPAGKAEGAAGMDIEMERRL
jgi:hypothetical protein